MRNFLTIFLLFIVSIVNAQIPGKSRVIGFPYTANGFTTQYIALRVPGDSTPGTPHWALFTSEGAGQVDLTNVAAFTYAPKSTGEYAASSNATFRFYDKKYTRFESGYIISIKNNQSNPLTTARVMACVAYMKANYPDMDTTQLYYNGLSLCGGEATALGGDTVNGKIFAAVGGMSPTQDSLSVPMMMGIQKNHLPTWFMDFNDDSNGPTGGNLQNMIFYCPNGAYASIVPNPRYYIPTPSNGGVTNHAGGWEMGMDTILGGRTILVDSGNFAGHSGHTNQSIVVDSSFYEWMLNYSRPAIVVSTPPSCTTNSTPANASTVPNSTFTTITWNFAATATSYNLYLWTTGSAPGSPTVSGITGLSYNLTGLTGATTYHWYIAPANSFGAATGCSSSATTFITPAVGVFNYQAVMYDLYNCRYCTFDEHTAYNLVDAQKNRTQSVWDPKNSVTGDTTGVGNYKHGFLTRGFAPVNARGEYGFVKFGTDSVNSNGIYYRKSRTNLVYDWTGMLDYRDTAHFFKSTDVYYKDNFQPAGIQTDVFKLNKAFTVSPSSFWIYFVNRDSLLQKIDSFVTTGDGAITHHILIDSFRYLIFVPHANVSANTSDIGEFAMYGQYNYDTAALRSSIRPLTYYGTLPTQNLPYDSIVGTNTFNGEGLNSLEHITNDRQYMGKGYIDTSTAQGIPTAFHNWPASSGDLTLTIIKNYKSNGKKFWWTNSGAGAYTGTGGVFAGQNYGRVNIDCIGCEMESPFNYKRDSTYFSEITKVLGRNSAIGNKFVNPTVASGQDAMNIIEEDNEVELFYDYHARFWRIKKAFQAVMNIDSTMKFMNGGLIDIDMQFFKTVAFFNGVEDPGSAYPIHIAAVHKYIANADTLGGIDRNYTEQQGMSSEHPAWILNGRGTIFLWDSIMRQLYNYAPLTTQMVHSELGHSRWGHAAVDVTEVTTGAHHNGLYEIYNSPSRGSWDSVHVKAIDEGWENAFACFTNLISVNHYSSVDQFGTGNVAYADLFFSMGEGSDKSISSPFDFTTFFPSWFYNGSEFRILKGYKGESVVLWGGKTGLTVLKYRCIAHTDSVKYVYGYTSKSAQTGTATFSVGSMISGNRQSTSFTSLTPTANSVTISGGNVSVPADETLQAIAGVETSGPILGPRLPYRPKRAIKRH